jgi:hypothetical protein
VGAEKVAMISVAGACSKKIPFAVIKQKVKISISSLLKYTLMAILDREVWRQSKRSSAKIP